MTDSIEAPRRVEAPDPAAARATREQYGWTRRRMADALRVDTSSVVRWESGVNRPTGRRLDDWTTLLDRMARELARSA